MTKPYLIWICIIIVLSSFTYADVDVAKGVLFWPTTVATPFNATTAFSATSIDVTTICVNITGGTFAGLYCNQSIGNCTTYGNTTLTLKIYDENDITETINETVQLEGQIWQGNPLFTNKLYSNFSFNLPYYNTHNLCLDLNQTTYVNIYLQHISNYGFTHRYYLNNESITGVAKTIDLYNWNTTTGASDLKITLRDVSTYAYQKNIIAKLQRRYLSEGVWRTVQMDKTGDFGLLHFNIREADTDYRLILMDIYNNVYETTNSMKFICDGTTCELTKTMADITSLTVGANISVDVTYNNNTNIITVLWTDPTGETDTVRTKVEKDTFSGTSIICNTTQTGSSGTYSCNVTGYSGLVRVYIYSTASPERNKFSKLFNLRSIKLDTYLGKAEGAFWSLGIAITIVMAGIAIGQVAALISLIFGLYVIYLLGFFQAFTLTTIFVSFIVAVVISFFIKR